MDHDKVGALIRALRIEKGLTQRALAADICVSDKTVSKWERGLGCPDVSLLSALSAVFDVHIEQILSGDLQPNVTDGGNMKRIRFYVCPVCGNILTATGEAELSCCGRKLTALAAKPADVAHGIKIEAVEDEYFLSFSHDMRKEHFLRFIAYVGYDRVLLVRLYPEQGGELRIPQLRGGKLYVCCSQHGLFVN